MSGAYIPFGIGPSAFPFRSPRGTSKSFFINYGFFLWWDSCPQLYAFGIQFIFCLYPHSSELGSVLNKKCPALRAELLIESHLT